MPRGAHLPEVNKPYRFVKGQSGNPGGRPKRTPLTDELRKLLGARAIKGNAEYTNAYMIAHSMIERAQAGDVAAARLVWEYVEGKAVQPIELDIGALVERLARERGLTPDEAIAARTEAERYLAELQRASRR